jgi:hypothetical protein
MRRQVLLENQSQIPINEDAHDGILMALKFCKDVNEIGLGLGCIEACGGDRTSDRCDVTGELYFAARLLGSSKQKRFGARS